MNQRATMVPTPSPTGGVGEALGGVDVGISLTRRRSRVPISNEDPELMRRRIRGVDGSSSPEHSLVDTDGDHAERSYADGERSVGPWQAHGFE